MKKQFSEQYRVLGIEAPAKDADPRSKADKIYEAACKVLEKLESLPFEFQVYTDYQKPVVAHYKLMVIRDAIIRTWKPDWNNRQQYKWSPWHWMDNPGFRFRDSVYDFTCSDATGGSRLCCQTKEQSGFLGIECIALYADLNGAELARG